MNNVPEESHFETLVYVLAPVPALTPIATPKKVEVSQIRNIMHEVLREHQEKFASIGYAT